MLATFSTWAIPLTVICFRRSLSVTGTLMFCLALSERINWRIKLNWVFWSWEAHSATSVLSDTGLGPPTLHCSLPSLSHPFLLPWCSTYHWCCLHETQMLVTIRTYLCAWVEITRIRSQVGSASHSLEPACGRGEEPARRVASVVTVFRNTLSQLRSVPRARHMEWSGWCKWCIWDVCS